jgi:hypothetical protein
MAFQRPQSGIIFIVLLFFFQMPSFAMPKFFLTDFLLPVYAVANLFTGDETDRILNSYQPNEWAGLPEIFGLHVYPVLLSLGLQLLIGIFLWRAAVRKTANPFQPALFRWEAVALFAVFIVFQHGLIWGEWAGHFPDSINKRGAWEDPMPLLPIVQGGTILLMIIILAFTSPLPESIRIKAMRLGIKSPGAVFPASSASLALILTAVAAFVLFLQFTGSVTRHDSGEIYLIAVLNLLAVSLIFSLLLEFCRLRFKKRALGFVALWLFVLCVLPFILALVFGNGGIARFSILAPGCIALANSTDENLNCLLGNDVAHLFIAVLLYIGWRREWIKLLNRAA